MDQAQLAQKMTAAGHSWTAATVGFVERGRDPDYARARGVTTDELWSLALIFKADMHKMVAREVKVR
jgi:hypothetical protein